MADITSNQMNSILSMNYRGLEDMPTSMMSSHSAADVQHLYMKGNRLTGVPETIYKFENLTVFITHTEIVTLAGSLDLTSIYFCLRKAHTNLYLHLANGYLQSNRIESLPQTIGALKTLELLDVSFNYLEKLPEGIGCLQKLKRLYAFSNRLKQLPKSVGALQNLEVLGVMKNEISSLPAEIGRLVNLKELNVDSNHLTSLPNQLCCLGHLQELSASNNNLLTLPQDFGMIKTLVNIFVDNNPFLNSLPLSLKSRTNDVKIGLNRCGIKDPPEHPVRAHQHVNIRWKNYKTIIILPKQISQTMCLMNTDMLASPLQLSVWKRDPTRDCDEINVTLCHDAEFMSRVPSLLELTLRTFHHVLLIRDKSDRGETLPQNIEELVHCPTAHCCQCNEVLFVSAFPFICQDNFSPQKPDAVFHFLGLCCTEQCFLQQLSGCLR